MTSLREGIYHALQLVNTIASDPQCAQEIERLGTPEMEEVWDDLTTAKTALAMIYERIPSGGLGTPIKYPPLDDLNSRMGQSTPSVMPSGSHGNHAKQ